MRTSSIRDPRTLAVAVVVIAWATLTLTGTTAASGDPNRAPAWQAYFCIFQNYFSRPVLESRSLLVPAFAALTRELQRRALDLSAASLPALVGQMQRDWAAFKKVYDQFSGRLPEDPRCGA